MGRSIGRRKSFNKFTRSPAGRASISDRSSYPLLSPPSLSIYLSFYVSLCPSINLSADFSAFLRLPIYLSICPTAHPSMHSRARLSIYLYIYARIQPPSFLASACSRRIANLRSPRATLGSERLRRIRDAEHLTFSAITRSRVQRRGSYYQVRHCAFRHCSRRNAQARERYSPEMAPADINGPHDRIIAFFADERCITNPERKTWRFREHSEFRLCCPMNEICYLLDLPFICHGASFHRF